MSGPKVWNTGSSFPIEISVIDESTGQGVPGLASAIGLHIRRLSDGYWWNGSSYILSPPAQLNVVEVDSTNQPGLYRHTFMGNNSITEEMYEARWDISAVALQRDAYELHVCRPSLSPSGAYQTTIRVVDTGLSPIVGATVAVFDASNTSMLAKGVTDSGGEVTVALDAATYNIRLACVGFTFTVPETLVVAASGSIEYTGVQWVPDMNGSPFDPQGVLP